jgi:hypothetical protein
MFVVAASLISVIITPFSLLSISRRKTEIAIVIDIHTTIMQTMKQKRRRVMGMTAMLVTVGVMVWINVSVLLARQQGVPEGHNLVSSSLGSTTSNAFYSGPSRGLAETTPIEAGEETRRPPKVLVGILSDDSFNGCTYRKRHKKLLGIWKDARTCSLPDYRSWKEEQRSKCELIYTFVVGGNPEGPTEIVDNTTALLMPKPVKALRDDINDADVTVLNIR